MTDSEAQMPRVLHVLPMIGFAGAEQMASNLLIPLSRIFQAGAVGLYHSINSSTEAAMRDAGIPLWFLRKRSGFDPRMFWRLDRVIREFQPNIVHSHLSVLRYLLPSLIYRRGIIAVHTIHNLAERETDRAGRFIHKQAFERFVVPVAVSRAVARSVSIFYGLSEPTTVPNGVPVNTFRFDPAIRVQWRRAQRLDDGAFLFIATGRLEPQKNPLLLLRAFTELADTRCHLLFAAAKSRPTARSPQ
jgi:glycosyltransferase involved in cell wall biosynthesis